MQQFKIAIRDDEIRELKTRLQQGIETLIEKKSRVSFDEGWRGRWSYGTDYDKLKDLAEYWLREFDWRKQEERLNRFSHFLLPMNVPMVSSLDDPERGIRSKSSPSSKVPEASAQPPPNSIVGTTMKIHFIHEISTLKDGSKHDKAIPLLLVHGWPGSIHEFTAAIPKLVKKDADRGDKCFHVVVPSLPGFGFSDKPSAPGLSPRVMAEMFHQLMSELGYRHYAIQGGDWGSIICRDLAYFHPESVCAMHLNMPVGFVSFKDKSLHNAMSWLMAAVDVSPLRYFTLYHWEVEMQDRVIEYVTTDSSYFLQHGTKPNTLGYALEDSPIGLLSWILEKFHNWTDNKGDVYSSLSRDDMLTDISIYWFTGTIASSSRIYYEYMQPNLLNEREFFDGPPYIEVPTGIASFPREIIAAPKKWCERAFNVKHHKYFENGGHFAAWENPEVFVSELNEFLFHATDWNDCVKQADDREKEAVRRASVNQILGKFVPRVGYTAPMLFLTPFMPRSLALATGALFLASRL